jgi:phosphatidate cytidylyltransferase
MPILNVIGGLEVFPALIMSPDPSLHNRLIIAAILIPLVAVFAWIGGWVFALFIALATGMAAYELWRLFNKGGYSPSLVIMLVFVPLASILRHFYAFRFADLYWLALILIATVFHIFQQQNGNLSTAAPSLFVTIGSSLYLGWLGGYAVSIRDLPQGFLWILLVLAVNALADTGAYGFGMNFGKHKMFPKVSPKKSWEGYLGGILTGALSGFGLAAWWQSYVPQMIPLHGLVLGLVIAAIAPFGDFGESMIKRSFKTKDSGTLLMDHGGILDRIDSALWAVPIGYYLILFFLA